MNILRFTPDAKEVAKRALTSGGYEAEFFVDTWSPDAPIYHYIVTQKDSTEILAWGQGQTLPAMERQAMDCIKNLYGLSLRARPTG